jgi:hypothetical protein
MTAQEGKTCAICGRKLDGRTGYQDFANNFFCLKHDEKSIYRFLER